MPMVTVTVVNLRVKFDTHFPEDHVDKRHNVKYRVMTTIRISKLCVNEC